MLFFKRIFECIYRYGLLKEETKGPSKGKKILVFFITLLKSSRLCWFVYNDMQGV